MSQKVTTMIINTKLVMRVSSLMGPFEYNFLRIGVKNNTDTNKATTI